MDSAESGSVQPKVLQMKLLPLLSCNFFATAAATLWGGSAPFARFHMSLDSFVIKNSPMEHPGRVCTHMHGIECSSELPRAIDMFEREGGRMVVADIVKRHGVSEELRECVRFFLWRLQRKIYITETMLRWLIQINDFGISVSNREFSALNGLQKVGRKNSRKSGRRAATTIIDRGLPKKPTNNFFISRRCDLQLWYIEILMRYVGRPVSDMNLVVVPNESVSVGARFQQDEIVLAPSADDVRRVLEMERQRIGMAREVTVTSLAGDVTVTNNSESTTGSNENSGTDASASNDPVADSVFQSTGSDDNFTDNEIEYLYDLLNSHPTIGQETTWQLLDDGVIDFL